MQDDNSATGITRYQNGPGIDDKLRLENSGGAEYFLTDHLGSTNALADSTGTITSSTNYDSFGNPTGTVNTRYQYTGRKLDADIGLYYYRARWYDSEIGRFISEDPIGLAGGINKYGYVGNNPASFRDPTGEIPVIAIPIIIGAAALILASPEYTNAPSRCDRVYRPENPLLVNAAAGAIGGAILGKAFGLFGNGLRRLGGYRRIQPAFGPLRDRVRELGTDPATGLNILEGVGGVRIERALGRPITRSTDVAGDFVDKILGPISLKGPIPARGNIEGLINASIKDATTNTFTRKLFVDLRGLTPSQAQQVRYSVISGSNNALKGVQFLD